MPATFAEKLMQKQANVKVACGLGMRAAWACMARPCYIVESLQKHVDDVGRGMKSPPLESTHGRQRRAWHDDITALGLHTRTTTSGVA